VSADGDHFTLLNVYKAFVANKNNKAGLTENSVILILKNNL